MRDAHDKYANQEVSYLLQRIDDYNGLVILASNRKANLDDAFLRRFNDIVEFTIPDEEERKQIWQKSFPINADYNGFPDKLKQYELTGANIINVIHYAGLQAVKRRNDFSGENANNNESLATSKLKFYLEDLREGIRREMIREGRPFV